MFFNIFIKFIIILNLLFFAFFSIFLNDLLIIWFFMEINNFMFICLLSYELTNKKIIFMYFIIQSISSLIILLTLILNFYNLNNMFLFILALGLKLGIPPFHLWMPLVSLFLSWKTLFFFLSIQKFIPLYIFSLIDFNPFISYYMILSSSFISIFKMINLLNLKLILTYSSINQLSWMLLLSLFKNILWLMYFLTYLIILLTINLLFMIFKFSSNYFMNIYENHQLILLFMFLNLAGLPPLSFFFLKWLSIYNFLFNSNFFLLFIILLFNSFILIYIYINMINLIMFFFSMKSKLMSTYFFPMNFLLIYLMLFSSLFLMLI